jgi:hypothetical protein
MANGGKKVQLATVLVYLNTCAGNCKQHASKVANTCAVSDVRRSAWALFYFTTIIRSDGGMMHSGLRSEVRLPAG